jgi:two-component system OmpR family sensor kinase
VGRLFWKILFAFWLALIAAAFATGSAVTWYRARAAQPETDLVMGGPAMMLTEAAASTLRHGGVDALRALLQDTQRARGPALFVVDARGNEILGRAVPEGALERARELAASAERPRGARLVAAPTGEGFLLFSVLQGEGRRFAGPMMRRPPEPPPQWLLFAIGGVASLAVAALLAWYLARPIRSLRWAFRAAAEGRLETRVRPLIKGRRDEIADLGDEFDQMAQQLQKLIGAQRRLLHDVSHELRSPLARLQAAIGLVRQDPAKLDQSLERIEREVGRLDALVGEVLTLARLEGGTSAAASEAFDLADLVAQVAEDARFEAEATARRVTLESVEHAPVRGRAELLHRAVENVVRNALKYTAENTAVSIDLSTEKRDAVLVVSDHGPGIAPEDLARVFEPFYRGRGDTSAQGFGLGLAIAHAALAAHGGTIRAENAPAGGLRVTMRLPVMEVPAK